jgi:hypothetical protein
MLYPKKPEKGKILGDTSFFTSILSGPGQLSCIKWMEIQKNRSFLAGTS